MKRQRQPQFWTWSAASYITDYHWVFPRKVVRYNHTLPEHAMITIQHATWLGPLRPNPCIPWDHVCLWRDSGSSLVRCCCCRWQAGFPSCICSRCDHWDIDILTWSGEQPLSQLWTGRAPTAQDPSDSESRDSTPTPLELKRSWVDEQLMNSRLENPATRNHGCKAVASNVLEFFWACCRSRPERIDKTWLFHFEWTCSFSASPTLSRLNLENISIYFFIYL